jgi:regulatory protein
MAKRKFSPKEYALKLLAARSRTEHEVRTRMKQKGYTEEEIEKTLEFLKSMGYLDEMEFAESFIIAKMKQGWAEWLIRKGLREKGLPSEKIDEAMEKFFDREALRKILMEKARKIIQLYGHLEKQKLLRKLLNYFERRGHSPSVVYKLLEELDGSQSV